MASPLVIGRLVWWAFVGAVAGYYAVLLGLPPAAGASELGRVFGPLLLVIGIAVTMTVSVVHRRFVAPDLTVPSPVRRDPRHTLAGYLACWVLAETLALFGFVIGLLGHNRQGVALFFVWAVALMVALRPRGEWLGAA